MEIEAIKVEPHITCEPVRVAVGRIGEDGFLIFADGLLVAVITYLRESVDERLKGRWFVEAGFGACSEVIPPLFDSPDAAQQWVLEHYRDCQSHQISAPSAAHVG